MKKKILLFLMIAAVFCTLFTGCVEDKNPNATTGSETTQTTNSATTESGTQASTPADIEATVPNLDELTFQDFNSMSQEEQKAVVDSFENDGEFFEWYEEKEEEYKENPVPPTTDGPIFPEATDSTAPEKDELSFLEYHNLSADEQKAFINTFESIDKFVEWHAAARQKYMDSLIEIDVTTPIDAADILEKNNGN